MKSKFMILVFAAFVAFSFTSCKKCFQCTVSNPVTGATIDQETDVTCDEKADDHKSVLEQANACVTCTETVGSTTISTTNCGTTEGMDNYYADQVADGKTCSKVGAVVNCYEAE